jgi:winged helix DNA-binding protein
VKDTVSAERGHTRSEFAHLLTIDGKLRGTWKPTLTRASAHIEVRLFRPLNADEGRALAAEAARYGRFVAMPVNLSIT